jgi:hypothetical protein
VIAAPISGRRWWNANGCCDRTLHRSVTLAVDGVRVVKPETFAIDWVQLRRVTVDGRRVYRTFKGDGTRNEQYFAHGAPVRSATDGRVVSVRDDMPEETPNQPPVHVHRPADFAGNRVVVRIRAGVYAQYAHLIPGTIHLRVGDRVEPGEFIGELGNSGNSTQPHLHFGLTDAPDALTSNSLPFAIDRYALVGLTTPESVPEGNVGIVGAPHRQRRSHPLVRAVTDFG